MKYVLLRDDDTNATTPVAVLERLFGPFLERDLPVNLAVIPAVATHATDLAGRPEAFVWSPRAGEHGYLPIAGATELARYLRDERRYCVVQHGLHHEIVDGHYELDRDDARDVAARLDRGKALLAEAGLGTPSALVAPQDSVTRAAVREILGRYPIFSTGYFDLSRVPRRWWPWYLYTKKLRREPHWRTTSTRLLTHPGCMLSAKLDTTTMLAEIEREIDSRELTVVVSHWYEYFDAAGQERTALVEVLHALAARLRSRRDVRVTTFDELAGGARAR